MNFPGLRGGGVKDVKFTRSLQDHINYVTPKSCTFYEVRGDFHISIFVTISETSVIIKSCLTEVSVKRGSHVSVDILTLTVTVSNA